MKIGEYINTKYTEPKDKIMSLTDFLNEALKSGYDVNNNKLYWINKYEEFRKYCIS